MSALPPALRRSDAPWLHGPAADRLVGFGLGYLLTVPLLLALGAATGLAAWPPAVVYALALLVSGPHYGATLLRVLERPEERQRYRRVALLATAGVAAWLVAATRDARAGSLLVTAYVFWSPWHFTGQNLGLAWMALRRRGVEPTPALRRPLRTAFAASFGLTLLALNAATSTALYAAGARDPSGTTDVVRVLLAPAVAWPAAAALGATFLGGLALFAARLGRVARPADLGPPLALALTQALWFGVPALLLIAGRGGGLDLPFAAAWISAAHALQYLWVTSHAARRADPAGYRTGRYLAKATLAGAAYVALPALLLAPSVGGGPAWDAGLATLVVSATNVHHFLLDGAIWKLREGRVARLLVERGDAAESRLASVGPRPAGFPHRALRGTAWAIGAVLLVGVAGDAVLRVATSAPTTSAARLDAANRALTWIGRESPWLHERRARALEAAGEVSAAVSAFERSLALAPRVPGWLALGALHERHGAWEQAERCYAEARTLDGRDGDALYRALRLEARRAGAPDPANAARAKLARRHAERPAQLAPTRALARAWLEHGRPERALSVLHAALASASSHGRYLLLGDIARISGSAGK